MRPEIQISDSLGLFSRPGMTSTPFSSLPFSGLQTEALTPPQAYYQPDLIFKFSPCHSLSSSHTGFLTILHMLQAALRSPECSSSGWISAGGSLCPTLRSLVKGHLSSEAFRDSVRNCTLLPPLVFCFPFPALFSLTGLIAA